MKNLKATGIIRTVDDLGRIVIPKEIRRNMDIRDGDPMEIYVSDGGWIVLKKYNATRCALCGSSDTHLYDIEDAKVCRRCALKIAREVG